mmetsp:Transcript_38149/g.88779  ORF Transcript_38149/g.88779 Transcript_38149/m.88779 type:complete len:270 (-) Transcript_38149:251-1060(-)
MLTPCSPVERISPSSASPFSSSSFGGGGILIGSGSCTTVAPEWDSFRSAATVSSRSGRFTGEEGATCDALLFSSLRMSSSASMETAASPEAASGKTTFDAATGGSEISGAGSPSSSSSFRDSIPASSSSPSGSSPSSSPSAEPSFENSLSRPRPSFPPLAAVAARPSRISWATSAAHPRILPFSSAYLAALSSSSTIRRRIRPHSASSSENWVRSAAFATSSTTRSREARTSRRTARSAARERREPEAAARSSPREAHVAVEGEAIGMA